MTLSLVIVVILVIIINIFIIAIVTVTVIAFTLIIIEPRTFNVRSVWMRQLERLLQEGTLILQIGEGRRECLPSGVYALFSYRCRERLQFLFLIVMAKSYGLCQARHWVAGPVVSQPDFRLRLLFFHLLGAFVQTFKYFVHFLLYTPY